MSQIFNCPSCSGSLDYDGGDHATVRCSYCGNTVIVPESMRSKAPNVSTLFTRSNQLREIVELINNGSINEAVDLYSRTFKVNHEEAKAAVSRLTSGLSLGMNQMHVQGFSVSNDPNIRTYRAEDKTGRSIGCLILFIIAFTVGIILVTTVAPLVFGGVALSSIFSSEDPIAEIDNVFSTLEASSGSVPVNGTPIAILPEATATPSSVNLALSFGTEGIAPGQFNDARALGIAPDGRIFVADRDSGRLQYFNAGGEVQGQWQMNEEKFIDGLTIDRAGRLFTLESSDIFRYDLETGEQQTQYTFDDTAVIFSGIATTANNQLIAINRVRGQIIRFDPEGVSELLVRIEDIPDATGFEEVAVDGSGSIYVLGTGEDVLGDRQEMVFKFNADGQYLTRFGKTGSEPGSFRAPNAITVDGQGRVYVGDIFGVHIFDNNGAFLDFFSADGSTFDLEFNNQGQLVITNRTTVSIYNINLR
jgi:sugar lactone lactonase YvrE